MEIRFSFKAANDLRELPKIIQKRIAGKMRFYASQQDPLKFAKRLTSYDEGAFRFRIGDYRVFFDAEKNIIYVLKISHRSEAY